MILKSNFLDLYSYAVFRIIVGVLFLTHGAQKLGWIGGSANPIFSQMGFVGLVEILGGLAIALGILTRLASLGGIILMIIIYFRVHTPKGILPFQNGGELALLYLVCFLAILSNGSGKYGIEKYSTGKEIF